MANGGIPAGAKLRNRLSALRSAFERGRAIDLKRISNDSINDAVLSNDRLLAELSIISYALSKLLSKRHIVMHAKWGSARRSILSSLEKAVFSLERGQERQFGTALQRAADGVSSVDRSMGNYMQGALDKARVKMASSAYAAGMSLGQAAELTHADRKELQSYVGFTKIHDEVPAGGGIKERLRRLEELMG
ncbi:MAG: hypothetical protein V1676_00610 [Candidatus Diapherotrites archaeon]